MKGTTQAKWNKHFMTEIKILRQRSALLVSIVKDRKLLIADRETGVRNKLVKNPLTSVNWSQS